MNQQQRDLRRAAARAFMESLDQLQSTFQPADPASKLPTVQPSHSTTSQPSSAATRLDLNSFEQAVADIEQFIQDQDKAV